MKVRTSWVEGNIYFRGAKIGVFTMDGDEVSYLINHISYVTSFNGFETMCEALGYDLKLL